MQTVFIYSLHCPITGDLRYVGKTNNLKSRLSVHLIEKGKNRRITWVQSLLMLGLIPRMEVVDEVLEELWQPLEAAYIQFFREGGCDLVNGTDGGDNPPPSKKGHCLGRKCSAETIAKMSKAKRGENHPRFGKQLSSEHRAKISVALSGERNHNFGKSMSAEQKAKISVSLMGNKSWNAGIPCFPETRAKISATKKRKKTCL